MPEEVAPKEEEAPKEEPEVKDEAPKDEDVKEEVKDEEMKDEVKEEAKEGETKEEDAAMEQEQEAEAPVQEDPKVHDEEDAPADDRAKVKPEQVSLNLSEATPNVMASVDEKMLMTLADGGFQYLLAGVHTSVAIKGGRYMFETRVVEELKMYEGNQRARTSTGKHCVRLGFSLAGASPLLDEGSDKFYFDNEGYFGCGKIRNRVAYKFAKENVVGVLLNLDSKTPNANTVTLYADGRRMCDPQPIPDDFKGKALYPSITYKNVTLQVNLGPTSMQQTLPFKCRMLQDAAAEDVEVGAMKSQDAKCEVLFPMGLPDNGIFDWLDQFLEENKSYTEISDRKILEWACKSGVSRPKGFEWKYSNDNPGMGFQVPALDDGSIKRTFTSVAPALKQDFVIMELQKNLVPAERKTAVSKFPASEFKRVAVVAMGDPSAKYKEKVQAFMLAAKVAEADAAKKEKERKAAEEAARKARDQQRNRRYNRNGEEPAEEGKDGEEAKEDGEAKEEKEVEAPIELTEDEKAKVHRPLPYTDLTSSALTKSFASFALPSTDEGFDEVRYVWQDAAKSQETLRSWVLEQKRTQRAEDLQPSAWFKERWTAWQKQVQEWRKKQSESKDAKRKAGAPPEKKDAKKAKVDGDGEEKEDAEGKEADGEEKPAEEEGEEKPAEEIDEDEIDVFTLENIYDIGNGKSLFANFVYEDWTLLGLRYELHLLVHSFRKDVDDPDRPSFPEKDFLFYYQKYFKKQIQISHFGVEKLEDLVALIKDSIGIDEKTTFLEAPLSEDEPLDKFLRMTEEHRRERQRCVDAGDETAVLKFTKPAAQPQRQGDAYGGGKGGGSRSYQSGGGGGGGYGGSGGGRSGSGGGQSGGARGGGGYGSGGGGGRDARGGGGSYGSGGRDSGRDSGRGGGASRGDSGGRAGGQSGSRDAQKRSYPPPPGPPSSRQRYDSGGSRGGPPPSSRGSSGGGSSYGGGGRSYR